MHFCAFACACVQTCMCLCVTVNKNQCPTCVCLCVYKSVYLYLCISGVLSIKFVSLAWMPNGPRVKNVKKFIFGMYAKWAKK